MNGKPYCYRHHHRLSWPLASASCLSFKEEYVCLCVVVQFEKFSPRIIIGLAERVREAEQHLLLRHSFAPLGLISEAVIGLKFRQRCRGISKQLHYVSQCWNKFCGHSASGKLIKWQTIDLLVGKSCNFNCL